MKQNQQIYKGVINPDKGTITYMESEWPDDQEVVSVEKLIQIARQEVSFTINEMGCAQIISNVVKSHFREIPFCSERFKSGKYQKLTLWNDEIVFAKSLTNDEYSDIVVVTYDDGAYLCHWFGQVKGASSFVKMFVADESLAK